MPRISLRRRDISRGSLRDPQPPSRVDRDITADDGTVRLHDSCYFLASIDPGEVRADELLAHVRNHWQIENSVFFLNDRWRDEDRHLTRRPGLSEWLAHLTTAATTVLRIFRSDPHEPLRAQADQIEWGPGQGLSNPLQNLTLQFSCLFLAQ